MAKEIQCAFGVDIDAVAGWLGSYGGEDSPSDIQRGVFAGEVGTPRLLELFEEYKIKASWFIPGHSIETFPEQTKMIAAAGHEIGAHGYSHENPVAMTRQQEEDILKKSIELIEGTDLQHRPTPRRVHTDQSAPAICDKWKARYRVTRANFRPALRQPVTLKCLACDI